MTSAKGPQFNIYPDLDREINILTDQPDVAGTMEETVRSEIEACSVKPEDGPPKRTLDFKNTQERADTIQEWAGPQIKEATDKWRSYRDELYVVPRTPDQLTNFMKDFAWKIDLLYRAYCDIRDEGQVNVEGVPISDTLRLVIIPWKEFQFRIGQGELQEWVNKMLEIDGRGPIVIPPSLLACLGSIQADEPIYTDPDNPADLLSAGEYLRKKIEQDGEWGIMLMQAQGPAGSVEFPAASPDEMTGSGTLKIGQSNEEANYSISDMGIFEWLALEMQANPQYPVDDHSWLLANTVSKSDLRALIPMASKEGLGLTPSDAQVDKARVRYCIGGPISPDLANRDNS